MKSRRRRRRRGGWRYITSFVIGRGNEKDRVSSLMFDFRGKKSMVRVKGLQMVGCKNEWIRQIDKIDEWVATTCPIETKAFVMV